MESSERVTASAVRISHARAELSLFAAAVAGLVFALCAPLAYKLNIWQDESYTLHTTANGLAYAFHEAVAFEQNAPLYFLLLSLWRQIDDSVFFLRLFSVLCAIATICLIPGISRRYVPQIDQRLTILAVAWNPFFIWSALQMRMYAMAILVSALLLAAFYEAFLAEKSKRYTIFLYALCCTVALYTEYYLIFLIAAQFLILLFYRRTEIGRYFVSVVLAGMSFAPMLALLPQQISNIRGPFAPPASILQSCGVLATILAHYAFPLAGPYAKFVYAFAVLGAAVTAIAKPRWLSSKGDVMMPLLTGTAALLFAAITYAAGVYVLNRHAAGLFVPAVLSVFALLTYVRRDFRSRTIAVWFTIAMVASTFGIARAYWSVANPGDWIRLTGALQSREKPGESIAIFEAENALPFKYYYRGPNTVTAIPVAVDFRHYDVGQFVVSNDRQLARTFPRGNRIWLITAGDCTAANVDFGCDIIQRYVVRHYHTLYDASFYQSRLRLLARTTTR